MCQRLISEVIVSPFLEFWLALAFSLLSLKMSWTQESLSSDSPSSPLIPQVRDLCSGSRRSRVPREVPEALNLIAAAGSILLTLVFICFLLFSESGPESTSLQIPLSDHHGLFILRENQAYRRKWGFPIELFLLQHGVWEISSEIVFFVIILFCSMKSLLNVSKKTLRLIFLLG